MRYPKGRRAPKNDGTKSGVTVQWAHERGEPDELTYFWRNSEKDLDTEGFSSCRRDTSLIMDAFESAKLFSGKTLKEELIERGYDISTFKFTIERLSNAKP